MFWKNYREVIYDVKFFFLQKTQKIFVITAVIKMGPGGLEEFARQFKLPRRLSLPSLFGAFPGGA